MDINRTRRRLNDPITANTVAPQAVTAPAPGLSALERGNRARRRSRELLDAIERLDTTLDPAAHQQIVDWVQEHYDARNGGQLLGLFGKCYLGPPFVDHMMAVSGHILEHFKPEDAVPTGFAPARPLVRSEAYLFVEVYSDGQVVPVRADGSSAV
jgi:hypothetical protein